MLHAMLKIGKYGEPGSKFKNYCHVFQVANEELRICRSNNEISVFKKGIPLVERGLSIGSIILQSS